MVTGVSRGVRLFFPAQLDDKRIVAVIATGSQFTHLSTSMARTLGLSEPVLARDRTVTIHDATGAVLTSRVHRFAKLGPPPAFPIRRRRWDAAADAAAYAVAGRLDDAG